MNRSQVLCIGEINLDIFCNSIDCIPEEGSFILVDNISFFPGGCPTNTAIVTAKFNLKTSIISVIGNDAIGKILLSELLKCNVNTNPIVIIDNTDTGKSIILLRKTKDRVILHYTGANNQLCIKNIDFNLIAESKSVLISSYISGLPNLKKNDVINIFKHAKENGRLTFLDVLIDPNENNPINYLLGLLEYTDFLLINRDEGKLLTGYTDYKKQANILMKNKANNVIIKLGKEGSFFKNDSMEYKAAPYKVISVDPAGAGDAFNGGIIYGCIQNWNIKKILSFANIVGASAVTKCGCTSGVYSLSEIEGIFSKINTD